MAHPFFLKQLVSVFPADHYIREEDLFMKHVESAYLTVEENPSLLVLLGLEPHGPEREYGYILPGKAVRTRPRSECYGAGHP